MAGAPFDLVEQYIQLLETNWPCSWTWERMTHAEQMRTLDQLNAETTTATPKDGC